MRKNGEMREREERERTKRGKGEGDRAWFEFGGTSHRRPIRRQKPNRESEGIERQDTEIQTDREKKKRPNLCSSAQPPGESCVLPCAFVSCTLSVVSPTLSDFWSKSFAKLLFENLSREFCLFGNPFAEEATVPVESSPTDFWSCICGRKGLVRVGAHVHQQFTHARLGTSTQRLSHAHTASDMHPHSTWYAHGTWYTRARYWYTHAHTQTS